jgi:hypothetical protein
MAREPVLGRKKIAPREILTVFGGLHYLRGNKLPYFSVTGEIRSEGAEDCHTCGCIHEEILKHFPHLLGLVALHLSDINGEPMYAVENGFYWLGGTTYQRPDFKIAAEHFRITETQAEGLIHDYFGIHFSTTAGFMAKSAELAAKKRLAEWVETQRARWKAEAEATIARHNLVIFGDPYHAAA